MADQTDQSTDFLKTACREVWWTCSKLPSTKQVSTGNKQEMVKIVGGVTSGYSISKRIFTSKHPAIQAVNEIFRCIDRLRDDYTIVKSASATSSEGRFQVEPGRRIIRVADIEEFEAQFVDLKTELTKAVAVTAACINEASVFNDKPVPSIKQLDKEVIGSSFDEKDYPSPTELVEAVKVTMPQYGVLKPDALLPAAVLKRECERVNQELGDTVALATNKVAEEIIKHMTSLARSLTRKVILDPVPGTFLEGCYPVEVLSIIETKQDRSLSPDEVKLVLSWPQADGNGGTFTKKITTDAVSRTYYHEQLRPRENGDKRALRTSSIENLNKSLECLSRVRSMLGSEGVALEENLGTIKSLLTLCSGTGDPSIVANELRTNEPLSTLLKDALGSAVIKLNELSEKAMDHRRKLVL